MHIRDIVVIVDIVDVDMVAGEFVVASWHLLPPGARGVLGEDPPGVLTNRMKESWKGWNFSLLPLLRRPEGCSGFPGGSGPGKMAPARTGWGC